MEAGQCDLISVIVPVYNVEKYLEKCVESIINQTYKQLEIILVDDGSTDQSGILCDEYGARDKRIKVIHKENGGLSDARNAGLDICSGKYVSFIDSDDYIHKEMIERLHREMNKGVELAICNFCRVDEEGNALEEVYKFRDGIIDQEQFWHKYYFESSVYCVVAWNKLYKREIFEEIHYSKGKVHEDEIILHNVIKQCRNISCISFTGYFYVQRKGSIVSVQNVSRYCDLVEGHLERARWFRSNNMLFLENMALRSGMCNFALMTRGQGYESNGKRIKNCYKEYRGYIWKNKAYKGRGLKNRMRMWLFMFSCNLYSKILLNGSR